MNPTNVIKSGYGLKMDKIRMRNQIVSNSYLNSLNNIRTRILVLKHASEDEFSLISLVYR